ncbi:MAG: 16S rRNA (cytosine(967)-C(5))-methyltransferase RsmB [Lachnospiraceae bacterium]|nr:16S rRNA (cytosine(967)-C(5))-methyltransferase RsmB [Lachnospiraceae bacterium]
MNKKNVRALALDIILQVMDDGRYCDRVLHRTLDRESSLTKQERSFLTRLVEGTVERCIQLDYILNQFSKIPVKKMKPVVRGILRMAVYQFFFLDNVPDSAACNEAVKLVNKRHLQGLRGFVNGVLRSILRGRDSIRYPDKSDFLSYASIKYSMPEWIVEYLMEEYNESQVESILRGFIEKNHGVTVRCNLHLKNPAGDPDQAVSEIRHSLEQQGVQVDAGILFPYALRIDNFDRLPELAAFREGRLQVQDESSMVVGAVSGIHPGQEVLDVCAAPGGKSLHAADLLENSGAVFACDVSESKVRLIQENMERAGVEHCELYRQNARILRKDWLDSVDVLIADLPCSGLGVIGGKCDIKYHTEREDIEELVSLQRDILCVVSRYVRPGGVLLYSTCTITKEENIDNVEWIRETLPFEPVSIEEDLPEKLRGDTGEKGYIQILPKDGIDGFFVAKFQRKGI